MPLGLARGAGRAPCGDPLTNTAVVFVPAGRLFGALAAVIAPARHLFGAPTAAGASSSCRPCPERGGTALLSLPDQTPGEGRGPQTRRAQPPRQRARSRILSQDFILCRILSFQCVGQQVAGIETGKRPGHVLTLASSRRAQTQGK